MDVKLTALEILLIPNTRIYKYYILKDTKLFIPSLEY